MGDAITDESTQGLRRLKKVFAAFEKLAPVGMERDTAMNRTLFYRLKLTEKSRRKNDGACFSVLIFLSKSPGRNWSE